MKKVKIGNQIWMSKNLNVDKFSNGDPIPHANSSEKFEEAEVNKQPCWIYYEGEPENGAEYGKLYNWYSVNDPRGLAPVGWRIPTDKDWNELIEHLGGEINAAKGFNQLLQLCSGCQDD